MRIILRGRQGTVDSFNLYSRRSVFSLIVVLLNFRKYRRSVLFPKIVVSALTGLVLYLCHDFSCLITGSRFWYCFNVEIVIVSVGGRNMFSISSLDKVIVSSGSWRSKT